MPPSIAIIGAGTAGTGAAHRAVALGARDVTIIDRAGPASGSSGRSAAIYNVQTTDPLHIELRMRARELFFRLERDRGLPLRRIGNARVAWTGADMARLEQVIAVQRSLGLGEKDSILLDRTDLQKLVPDLNTDDLSGALFGPNDGVIDGGYLCRTLLEDAEAKGARYLQAELLDHTVTTAGTHVLHTTHGTIEADYVINAAGAWAGKVGALLGCPVPVQPQVHDIVKVTLPHRLEYTVPMINTYMPGSDGEALYFRQFDDTTLLAGFHTYAVLAGHPVVDPDDYRTIVQPGYMRAVGAALEHRLRIDDLKIEPGWTGLYPLSPDAEFIIGPEPSDNTVVTCTGLGGVGVTSGAMAGYAAAEWILQSAPTTVPGIASWVPGRPTLETRTGVDA